MKDYPIPDKLYQILKWAGLALFPALSLLIATLGQAWGFDAQPWVITIDGIGVFIAAVIGYSALAAKKPGDK